MQSKWVRGGVLIDFRYWNWWESRKINAISKRALMEPINIQELQSRGPKNALEELRLRLYEDVNKIGIGAQGLGGLTTVLDVKILDYPCHAASLPVAMIPNCAATRHIHFTLKGEGAASFVNPSDSWPDIELPIDTIKRVKIEDLNKQNLSQFKSGYVALIRKILTARDAAHKRITSINRRKASAQWA